MLKCALLLLAIAALCSCQITRSNYAVGECNTAPNSLFQILRRSDECLTGNVYPFNGESRRYTCVSGNVGYYNCTDSSCGTCSETFVNVGATVCIPWTTLDHSDVLSCGTTLPETPVNTPLITQYDGNSCQGNLQFQGGYSTGYCAESGARYSCNATTFVNWNCTRSESGCSNCVVLSEVGLFSTGVCSGYTHYDCLNATGTPQTTGDAYGTTTTGTTTTSNTTVSGTTSASGTSASTSANPGGYLLQLLLLPVTWQSLSA